MINLQVNLTQVTEDGVTYYEATITDDKGAYLWNATHDYYEGAQLLAINALRRHIRSVELIIDEELKDISQ